MSGAAQTSPECFICRKQRGEITLPGGIIYQDERLTANHVHLTDDQAGVYLGWLVIETRRHAPGRVTRSAHRRRGRD